MNHVINEGGVLSDHFMMLWFQKDGWIQSVLKLSGGIRET